MLGPTGGMRVVKTLPAVPSGETSTAGQGDARSRDRRGMLTAPEGSDRGAMDESAFGLRGRSPCSPYQQLPTLSQALSSGESTETRTAMEKDGINA